MVTAALFYLATIYLITFVVRKVEKSLRKSEMRGAGK